MMLGMVNVSNLKVKKRSSKYLIICNFTLLSHISHELWIETQNTYFIFSKVYFRRSNVYGRFRLLSRIFGLEVNYFIVKIYLGYLGMAKIVL